MRFPHVKGKSNSLRNIRYTVCACEHLSSDLDLSQVFYSLLKARRFEEYIVMAALISPSRLRGTLAEISLD